MSNELVPGPEAADNPGLEEMLTPDEQLLSERTRQAIQSGELEVVSLDEAERRLRKLPDTPDPKALPPEFQKWDDEHRGVA